MKNAAQQAIERQQRINELAIQGIRNAFKELERSGEWTRFKERSKDTAEFFERQLK